MEKNQILDKLPAERTNAEIAILFKISYGRDFCKGSLHNISHSGAFLFVQNKDIEQNADNISLYIQLKKRNRKLSAKVVWKTHFGYGLQFVKTLAQDKQLIKDLIYFESKKNKAKQAVLRDIFKKVA